MWLPAEFTWGCESRFELLLAILGADQVCRFLRFGARRRVWGLPLLGGSEPRIQVCSLSFQVSSRMRVH